MTQVEPSVTKQNKQRKSLIGIMAMAHSTEAHALLAGGPVLTTWTQFYRAPGVLQSTRRLSTVPPSLDKRQKLILKNQ